MLQDKSVKVIEKNNQMHIERIHHINKIMPKT